MCRNIKTLFNFDPPATHDEIRDAALQFVRKLSGTTRPSQRNQAAFDRAVEAIAESALERKIGARGLRMIIEELMLDLMYQVPNQKKVREVTITREVVLARDKPITLIEKAG